MVRDKRIQTSINSFDLTDEQIAAARLTVARNARSHEELAYLLDVLGLFPRKKPVDVREVKKAEVQRKKEERKVQWEREIEWMTDKGGKRGKL